MAAQLAGEAAIRIVPSLRNFRSRVQSELSRKPLKFDIEVRPKVDTSLAKKQLEEFRARERADAINLKARVDIREAQAAFSRVEHIFKRSALSKAIRLNIVVLGGDAVYSAAGALGSLSAAADTAVTSLVALPGAFASMGVAAGVFAASIHGIKDAFKGLADDQKNSAKSTLDIANAQRDAVGANRDLARATKDVGKAYRDATRDVEDMLHAVRRGSLDEAGALLNLQDAIDDLADGSSNIKELRREQLAYAEAIDDLGQVRTKNKRNIEDYNDAQAEGISQSDKVQAALDKVADAQNRVADAADRMSKTSMSKGADALAKLAPEAQEFVRAVDGARGTWEAFQKSLAGEVFRGQGKNFLDTMNISIKNLGPGLQGVATEIGNIIHTMGDSVRSDKNQGFLAGIIGNTKTGLATLREGIDPLITGLLRISDSSAFPKLAEWIVTLTNRWDAWTEKIKASGQLEDWITRGIRGLDALVNTATNLVSFIGSVAEAWRTAGGEEMGVIGSAEKLTKTLADWGSSQKGQNSMVTYFKQVREFIANVVEALKGIGPTLSEISSFAREWSAVMLDVLSGALRLTSWAQENFGIVKPLLLMWLSFRTVRPIFQALSAATGNYTKIVKGLGDAGVPVFDKMNRGHMQLQSNMDLLKGKATSSIDPFKNLTTAQTNYAKATSGAFTGTNNMTSALKNQAGPMASFYNNVGTATGKVGFAGVKSGLMGAVGGLAAFLGPGAAFAAAMAAGLWAVNKLGEAHRNAARDADEQAAALGRVKGALDTVTGAVTQQTTAETAKQATEGVAIPNFPGPTSNRKIFEDLARTGLNISQRDLLNATNPTQTGAQQQVFGKLDAATKGKLEESDAWKRGHQFWEDHGVNSDVMARAMNGDQDAVAQVNSAEKAAFDPQNTGNLGNAQYQSARRAELQIGSVSDYIEQAQTFDTSSVGIFGRSRLQAAQQGGQQVQAQNQAQYGPQSFKPGQEIGGAGARVYRDQTGVKVETSGKVPDGWVAGVPTELGQAVILDDDRGQISLSPEAASKHIQGYRDGGLIRGSGTGTSDSNTINASYGEFILRKPAVDAIGVSTLDRMNHGGLVNFSGGGWFPAPKPWVQPPVTNFGLTGTANNLQGSGFQSQGQSQLAHRGITAAPVTPGPTIGNPIRPVGNFFRAGLGLGAPGYNETSTATITRNVPPPIQTGVVAGSGRGLGEGFSRLPGGIGLGGTGSWAAPLTTGFIPGGAGAAPGAQAARRGLAAKPASRVPTPVSTTTTSSGTVKTPDGISHSGGPGTASGYTGSPSTDSDAGYASAPPGTNTDASVSPYGETGAAPGPGVINTNASVGAPPYGAPTAPLMTGEYGLPTGTNSGGYGSGNSNGQIFPDWAVQLGAQFGVTPSTYGGHQETDRNEPGYAPNPNHENRGIDWSGSPENMQKFADYVKTVPGMEQVIWNGQGIGTGDTVEVAGGRPQPGYFAGDLAGHGNHVHTRQSTPIPLPGQALQDITGGTTGPGMPQGFINPDDGTGSGTGKGDGKKNDPYSQKNIDEFLSGQFSNVGKTLATVGTTFISAFTGLDLGMVTDTVGKITGDDSLSGDGDETGLTEGDATDTEVSGDISSFLNIPGLGNPQSGSGSAPTSGSAQEQVHAAMIAAGYPESEWPALKQLIQGESSWKPTNKNPSSGAFGLFQFLGHENDEYGKMGGYSTDPSQQAVAGLAYIKNRYGTPSAALKFWQGNNPHWYAKGGAPKGGPINVSRGEYRFGSKAVNRIGLANLNSMNQGFVGGGLFGPGAVPFIPKPVIAPPPPPTPPPAPAPSVGNALAPKPAPLTTPGPRPLIGPSAVGAPAPAPAPGAPLIGAAAAPPIPQMQLPPTTGLGSALGVPGQPSLIGNKLSSSGIPGMGMTPPGASQPGTPFQGRGETTAPIDPMKPEDDKRGDLNAVGPAPKSNEHTNPAIKSAIKQGAAHAGQIGAMAAGMFPGGGAAGGMIQGGAEIAGQVAAGMVNVLSSAGVGSIMDIGTQATPSGAALVPQRAPQQFGQLPNQSAQAVTAPAPAQQGPQIINNYNGGIHTQNMTEWQRTQQRLMDQQSQPFISKYPG